MDELTQSKIALEQKWLTNNGPSFSVTIDGLGNIEYKDVNNAKTLINQISKITQQDVIELLNEAETIYFFSLRDTYGDLKNYPNSPQISISIQHGNRYKNIKYVKDKSIRLPRSLLMFEKKIEKITNVSSWTDIV